MKYIFLILGVLVFNQYSNAQKNVILKGEEEVVYPFETNSEKMYFDWIKNIPNFGNIQVFAMGEATHGTKDFFDIKAKSFEYLVKHENFRIFGIEASYGECSFINDYIQTGIGEIDSVMHYFNYWTWRTEEVKALILWMKEYNKSNTEKIKFYGFDMQSICDPIKYLEHFFSNDSSDYVHAFRDIIKPITSKHVNEVWLLYAYDNQDFKDTLNNISKELEQWFSKNESALIKQYTSMKLKLLEYNLITYKQGIDFCGKGTNKRDSCMAKNVLEIQKIENEKMFIWAHNGHVNKSSRFPQTKWMGELLFEELQFKYYTVGFVFSEGSFQTYDKTNKEYKTISTTIKASKKNTFTKPLDELGEEQFFIDLQQSNNTIFKRKLKTYVIGSTYFKKKWLSIPIKAKEQFDGIIYIKNTSSAVSIDK